ncbi:hypothetical protein AB0E63_26845 [Kribbella sp. NPDC026596]|uniref:hypothetical protein n=1 Tax=Kribbella sp. NPDC026596 TaxID=3155122 RepID=UPI0033E8BD68
MTNESEAAYERIQEQVARGWNTWDTRSVLTQVLLPEGLGLSFGLKEYYRGTSLRTVQIGRRTEGAETVTLGRHAYGGSYTETTVSWAGITIRVQTAHTGDDLVALVTPTANQQKSGLLTIAVNYLWNRPGIVSREPDHLRATPGTVTPDADHLRAAAGTALPRPVASPRSTVVDRRIVDIFATAPHVDDP